MRKLASTASNAAGCITKAYPTYKICLYRIKHVAWKSHAHKDSTFTRKQNASSL